MFFGKSKKTDLREVNILYQIEGKNSTLTISHLVTDKDVFSISIVKNKYKNVAKYTKQDMLIMKGWKLRMLAEWLTRDFSDWESSSEFFDPMKSLVLECDCHSELLVTYYNKEDKEVYLEMFDNHWNWSKKFSSEFIINSNDISFCKIGKEILTILKPYIEKN